MNAAAAGTLTFMVGAETDDIFSEAKSLLEGDKKTGFLTVQQAPLKLNHLLTDYFIGMGAKITHCGGVGTGERVKVMI